MSSTEAGRDRDRSDGPMRGSRLSAMRWFALTAIIVLALDQLTKRVVDARLPAGARWPGAEHAISRYFTFTHVHNTGMAFGLGQGKSTLFLALALAVTAFLVIWQWRLSPEERLLRVALGLQVGGALGNAFDRVRQGWVTDFLDFQFFPVFNVADSAISIGVAILAWHLWQEGREEQAAARLAKASQAAELGGVGQSVAGHGSAGEGLDGHTVSSQVEPQLETDPGSNS